jgi:hypothetical protein
MVAEQDKRKEQKYNISNASTEYTMQIWLACSRHDVHAYWRASRLDTCVSLHKSARTTLLSCACTQRDQHGVDVVDEARSSKSSAPALQNANACSYDNVMSLLPSSVASIHCNAVQEFDTCHVRHQLQCHWPCHPVQVAECNMQCTNATNT